MNDLVFQNIIDDIKKKNLNLESLIITQNDKEYKYLFVPEKLKNIRSISKTITGLVLGVAISKGYFKAGIDTYIMLYFKNKKITNVENLKYLNKIQIKHLISFTFGYDKQVLNKKHLDTIEDNLNLVEFALNYPLKYVHVTFIKVKEHVVI